MQAIFVEGLGVISDKLPIIADATSAIKVSTAGLGSSFSALAPIFGAVLAPAAVVAGYKVVADHVTEAIETRKIGSKLQGIIFSVARRRQPSFAFGKSAK